jgi:hypothetical protein
MPSIDEPFELPLPSPTCRNQHLHRSRTPRCPPSPNNATRPRVRGRIAPNSVRHNGSRSQDADCPSDRTRNGCGCRRSYRREPQWPSSSTNEVHDTYHGDTACRYGGCHSMAATYGDNCRPMPLQGNPPARALVAIYHQTTRLTLMRHAFQCGGEPRRLAKASGHGTEIEARDAIGAKTPVVTRGTVMRIVSHIAGGAT